MRRNIQRRRRNIGGDIGRCRASPNNPLRCSSTAGLATTSDSEALPNMNPASASTEIPTEDLSCTSITGMAGAVEALTTVPAISVKNPL